MKTKRHTGKTEAETEGLQLMPRNVKDGQQTSRNEEGASRDSSPQAQRGCGPVDSLSSDYQTPEP